MSRQTIRLKGKSHSMWRCFGQLYQGLWAIDGGEIVGVGKFFRQKYKEYRIKIQYENPTTRTIRLKATRGSQSQYFFVRAQEGEEELMKKEIYDLIR